MSQKGKKGTGEKPTNDFGVDDRRGAQKGIRAKPVPKRSDDK